MTDKIVTNDVEQETTTPELIANIARITRRLRESMRDLGLDETIKEAADAIPNARDRLQYVARMTEQAANRVLNASEQMQPMQESMGAMAKELSGKWQEWFEGPKDLSEAKHLVDDTRAFLNYVPDKTDKSLAIILEIIMAQDFQDLTGQVITRMLDVISTIETELIQVLIDSVPKEQREATATLLNGPQVSANTKDEVVSNQDQVDDLLASLGF